VLGYHCESTLAMFVRKPQNDFFEMCLHHVLTIPLIAYAYVGRYGPTILIITLIIDNSDIWIGLIRGVMDLVNKAVTVIILILLLTSWIYFRIFLMFTEVCYGAGYDSR